MRTIDLSEGLKIAREFEAKLAPLGVHVALAGSVMYAGTSNKDLDLILYPHQKKTRHDICDALLTLVPEAKRIGGDVDQYPENRFVLRATIDGARVEFFIFSEIADSTLPDSKECREWNANRKEMKAADGDPFA